MKLKAFATSISHFVGGSLKLMVHISFLERRLLSIALMKQFCMKKLQTNRLEFDHINVPGAAKVEILSVR